LQFNGRIKGRRRLTVRDVERIALSPDHGTLWAPTFDGSDGATVTATLAESNDGRFATSVAVVPSTKKAGQEVVLSILAMSGRRLATFAFGAALLAAALAVATNTEVLLVMALRKAITGCFSTRVAVRESLAVRNVPPLHVTALNVSPLNMRALNLSLALHVAALNHMTFALHVAPLNLREFSIAVLYIIDDFAVGDGGVATLSCRAAFPAPGSVTAMALATVTFAAIAAKVFCEVGHQPFASAVSASAIALPEVLNAGVMRLATICLEWITKA